MTSTQDRTPRTRGPGVGLWLAGATLAGCTSIAGLEGDYQVGDTGGTGGATSSGTGGSTSTSGTGGSSASSGDGGTSSSSGSGGATSTSSGTGGGGGSTSSGTGGQGGTPPTCTGTHEYQAVVADCIDLTAPDPDTCEYTTGWGEMHLSTAQYSLGTPHHSFVRFDLDANVAQSPLSAVTLRLVVPNTSYAESSSSGEVWRVNAFVRNDLFYGEPANVGNSPLAGSVGSVALGQTVNITLPTTGIMDGNSVYLGLRPLVSNGTDYENLHGNSPPLLIVTCQ